MRMKRMPLAPAVFAGLALLLSPAFADDNHDHAGTHAHAGKHGGTVVETPIIIWKLSPRMVSWKFM